jgi:hypothetical protein
MVMPSISCFVVASASSGGAAGAGGAAGSLAVQADRMPVSVRAKAAVTDRVVCMEGLPLFGKL